jgi:cell shape-determining protein MreC
MIMSVYVKWVGLKTRTNSYGIFTRGEPVEVPDHVAKELLKLKFFVEATPKDVAMTQATDTELRTQLTNALADNEHLKEELAQLQEQNNVLQEQLAAFETAEEPVATEPVDEPVSTVEDITPPEESVTEESEVPAEPAEPEVDKAPGV